ncbi:MAG: DUF1553 domain-containing protein, partial [Planctomycetes bacterium]|nr:DUF1553 domain-containing protein [Planctomycetota bacterium]
VARLRHADPSKRMPPARSKQTVTEREIARIEEWIRNGGAYAAHWADIPPRRPEPPVVTNARWARDPIDHFALRRMRDAGLQPSEEASKETFLRRVSLALTGLPPTPEEIGAFAADATDGAHATVVDRLLASPRFGERMAQDWLDVARYADTYGYQADVARRVWPYRDWVIRAFRDNLPYDRFLTWQIAGDLLPNASEDQRLATAFCRLHRQTNEGGSVEEEYRVEYVADRTETVATAFLGMTLGCARCHDHKFDPLPQRDYYRLTAFFANIDESGLYSHFTRATPTPALDLPSPEQREDLARLERRVADAEHRREVLGSMQSAQQNGFRTWLGRAAAALERGEPTLSPIGRVGDYPLEDLAATGLRNRCDPTRSARAHDGPRSGAGVRGNGVVLSGDNSLTFPGVGAFRRTDAFTFALWLRVPTRYPRAVVLHRSRAWTDAGSQGYQLLVENGHLSWSLVHFWPGDAIAVRTVARLPVDRWVHVTVTYDGSSRAGGLHIYLDGSATPSTVVRDRLRHSITGGGELVLTLGQRFRDNGLAGGSVDELLVFNRCLTPVEVAELHTPGALAVALRVAAGKARSAAKDWVTDATRELHALYCATLDPTASAAAQQLQKARVELAKLRDSIPQIMTMRERSRPRPTHVLRRGGYDARGERVEPGTPGSLPPFPTELPRDRLGLARWMVDGGHPRTARVAVNRLWSLMFGRGLVATPEDFGSQGEPPSHPLLLDWLATEFVASGWNVQAMLRRIALSATFRQSSVNPRSRSLDPDNRLLARGPSRRLTAEMLRDQALFASGLLAERIGGPSVKPYQPPGLWKEKSGQTYVRSKGEGLYRRSLYTFWKRTSPPPSMLLFDASKREVCVVRRQETNTPLQALVLWNDPQLVEAARVLAERTLREAPSAAARIRLAFRRLATRAPTVAEVDVLRRLLDAQHEAFRADPAAARALLAVGDKRVGPKVDPAELAAFSTVCSTLLGHDAVVMVR